VRGNPVFSTIAFLMLLSASLCADCIKNHDLRSDKNSGLLIVDLIVKGTQSLSSDELTSITSGMIGSCFDDNSDELEERIRALFQDRGYFQVVLNSLHVKPNDPIAVPKPVLLEAEITEGLRYRVGEIAFTGNNAFAAAELAAKFPMKKGNLFTRNKVASGLENLRKLYLTSGFIDFWSVPETTSRSDATIALTIEVTEGRQYHMGKVEILAKKEIAERLLTAWELPAGAVFDGTYVEKYLDKNRALLPDEFQAQHALLLRNCDDSTVDVNLPIDATEARSQTLPTVETCEAHEQSPK
jgi:outer membrane protein assembly factor BamA